MSLEYSFAGKVQSYILKTSNCLIFLFCFKLKKQNKTSRASWSAGGALLLFSGKSLTKATTIFNIDHILATRRKKNNDTIDKFAPSWLQFSKIAVFAFVIQQCLLGRGRPLSFPLLCPAFQSHSHQRERCLFNLGDWGLKWVTEASVTAPGQYLGCVCDTETKTPICSFYLN